MKTAYYFPWVRKGMGTYIQEKDAFGEQFDEMVLNRPEIRLTADFSAQKDDSTFGIKYGKTVKFVGPSDVAGVNDKAVMKVIPAPDSSGFPVQFFPYVEFYEPDFPWRYTPASHNEDRLRPWITLVCLETSAVQLKSFPNGTRYCTFIGSEGQWKDCFLKPSQQWRSAHAQGETGDRADLSRLLALRNSRTLEKDTEYRVLMIPAFETGRLRGLGLEEADVAEIPAQLASWDEDFGAQKNRKMGLLFPVYYTWTFKSGLDQFDTMVARLKPAHVDKNGIILDVTRMGEGLDYDQVSHFNSRRTIEMPAATRTIGSKPEKPFPSDDEKSTESILYGRIGSLLRENPVFTENASDKDDGFYATWVGDDDPLVVPPVYGARHVLASSLDEVDWVKELNMDVHYRAAAGLGRSVIQTHQEELMNRAWKQVNAVNALNRDLYNRLLSLNAKKSMVGKLPQYAKGKDGHYLASMMQILGSMAESSDGTDPWSSILGNADIPKAFASATFQKTTEELSRLVADLDPTSVMDSLLKEQFYRKGDSVRHDALSGEQLLDELEKQRNAQVVYDRTHHPMAGHINYQVKDKTRPDDCTNLVNKELAIGCRFDDVSLDDYLMGRQIPTDPLLFLSNYFSAKEDTFGKGSKISDYLSALKAFFETGLHHQPTFGFVVPDEEFQSIREGFPLDELHDFANDFMGGTPLTVGWASVSGAPVSHKNDKSIQLSPDRRSLTVIHREKGLQKTYKPNLVILQEDAPLFNSTLFFEFDGRYFTSWDDFPSWYGAQGLCVFKREFSNSGTDYMVLSMKCRLNEGLFPAYADKVCVPYTVLDLLKDPSHLLSTCGVGSWQELDKGDLLEAFSQLYYYVLRAREWALSRPSFVILPQSVLASSSVRGAKKGVYTWKKGDMIDWIFPPFPDSAWRPVYNSLKKTLQQMIATIKVREEQEKTDQAGKDQTSSASEYYQTFTESCQETFAEDFKRMRTVAEMYYAEFFADNDQGAKLREGYIEELLLSKYPILAYPIFPEPTSYYLKMMSEKFIVPGVESIPEDSVAMFESNPAFIEAFLCGMNTEMGQELLWREYPTDRRGSYFRKFWDSESTVSAIHENSFFDINPVHAWSKELGGNHLGSKGDLLIFTIRGKLMRQYPGTRVYLHRAVADVAAHTLDFDPNATEENGGIILPVMETFLKEDTLMVGFKTTIQRALGNPALNGNYGFFLTFEEDVEDLNFQFEDEVVSLEKLDGAADAAQTADRLKNKPTIFGKHVSLFVNAQPAGTDADGGAGTSPAPSPGADDTTDDSGGDSPAPSAPVADAMDGTVILSKPEVVECDGVYQSDARLHVDLGKKLDRNHYGISFDFKCASAASKNDTILVLDTAYRSLGLVLKSGNIGISVVNGVATHITPISFKLGVWQHVDLVFNDGEITLNGHVYTPGPLNGPGNNILSSNNFSNGHCFKGQIRNLVVRTLS